MNFEEILILCFSYIGKALVTIVSGLVVKHFTASKTTSPKAPDNKTVINNQGTVIINNFYGYDNR